MMTSVWTPARLEEECLFTRSSLEFDPNASDFLPATSGWLAGIDDLSAKYREVRERESRALSDRQISHASLCDQVMGFSRALLTAVVGNRNAARYLQFFPQPPSDLVHRPQSDLAARVKGWLREYDDEVLELYAEGLSCWAERLDSALATLESVRSCRFKRDAARAELCAKLTLERNQLYADLCERATSRSLERRWADRFFMRG